MITLIRSGGRLSGSHSPRGSPPGSPPPSRAGPTAPRRPPRSVRPAASLTRASHKHPGPGVGTLGYGKPGLYPGFQGSGLGYHLGYGYGGNGLGVGAEGGYPFYGGPGYPHPSPTLRRVGGINPFPFYGGPGGPTPACPNYFGAVGPLVAERPVIEVEAGPGEADYSSGYGAFTGVIPYSEAALAPFTTSAAAGGSSSGIGSATPPNAPPNTAPAPGEVLDEHAASRSLGLDVEPFTDPAGGRGLKITRVQPDSPAQKAGLKDGDVVRSANGYVTELPTNLAWILANAAADKALKMSVRSADGTVRTVTLQLP